MGADGSLIESRPVSTVLGARGKCQAEGPGRRKEEETHSANEENVTAAKPVVDQSSIGRPPLADQEKENESDQDSEEE